MILGVAGGVEITARLTELAVMILGVAGSRSLLVRPSLLSGPFDPRAGQLDDRVSPASWGGLWSNAALSTRPDTGLGADAVCLVELPARRRGSDRWRISAVAAAIQFDCRGGAAVGARLSGASQIGLERRRL